MEVYNENFFIGLEDYELEWSLKADGAVIRTGRITELDVAPQSRRVYALGFNAGEFPASGELLLDVAYRLKVKQPLLDPGTVVARQQLEIRPYDCAAACVLPESDRGVKLTVWERGKRVEGDNWSIFFSREGFVSSYCVEGRELLARDSDWPATASCGPTSGAPRPRTTSAPAFSTSTPSGKSPSCASSRSTRRWRRVWPASSAAIRCPPSGRRSR